MNKFIIITDSSADLSKEIVDEIGIKVIPMEFTLNSKQYLNDLEEKDISIKEVYKQLREGKVVNTSQISPNNFIDFFTPYLKQQYDILYLSFSSALSGTYNSSLVAIDILKEEYKDQTIYSVDSKCASLGEGLFVYQVAKFKDGHTLTETYEYAEQIKLSICHLFTVDDLNFLKRGGRLSASKAFLGSILSLKPVLHVSNEGKLVPIGKTVGRESSLKNMIKRMIESGADFSNQVVFISHGDCQKDLDYVIEMINKMVKPKAIRTNLIGPVIGAHSGPGTMAIFFQANKR